VLRDVYRACCAVLLCLLSTLPAAAETAAPAPAPRWDAPFGGKWSASFTVASDYAASGISNTQLKPAIQGTLDYRTPNLLGEGAPRLWAYGYLFGSNVSFQNAGDGTELDLGAGFKMRLMNERLGLSLGYIRYVFPDIPASFGFDYGEVEARVDYDFGWMAASARLRWSNDGLGHVGQTLNARVLFSTPLSFLKLPFDASMRVYGSLGSMYVTYPDLIGLPRNDYQYWQAGLVTSIWGLDVTVAYTDTSLEPTGCGNTYACAPRVFVAVSKVF
jgi:uncharacterized protein (TIGR02001 family)